MITYFKYTQGDDFTLNGVNYIGYFNVINSIAYTDSVYSSTSQVLTPNNTFAAAIYLERGEFDRTVDSTINLARVNVNPRDILNFSTLQNLISSLDYNNKQLYRSSVIVPLDTINFKNLPVNNTSAKFYGLSSTIADIHTPKDINCGKRTYTQIDPFSFSPEWAFMDETIGSSFFVNPDESFFYSITTPTETYTLSGNINNNSTLVIVSNSEFTPNTVLRQNNVLGFLYEIGDNSILVYDLETYNECGSKILIDSLVVYDDTKYQLKDDNKKFIKFGRQLRGVLVSSKTNASNIYLDLRNSQSNEEYTTISYDNLNLSSISCYDIRDQDDALIVIGKRDTDTRMILIDTSTLTTGSLSSAIISDTSILYAQNVSDVFFSRTDSNKITLATDGDLQTRFLSNPKTPASTLNPDNLLFLRKYTFNDTRERFDKTLIKFNSNKLQSNYPNLISSNIINSGSGQYVSIQYIGRLYVFKLTAGVDINNLLPRDLVRYNTNTVDCSNSYLAITLNKNLYNIISDTLNIYNNYSRQVAKVYVNDIPLLGKSYRRAEVTNLNILNFYLHENESVNVLSLQRAFGEIYNLQTAIASSILSGIN